MMQKNLTWYSKFHAGRPTIFQPGTTLSVRRHEVLGTK